MSSITALETYLAMEEKKNALKAASKTVSMRPEKIYEDLDSYVAFERALLNRSVQHDDKCEESVSILVEIDNFINVRLEEYNMKRLGKLR